MTTSQQKQFQAISTANASQTAALLTPEQTSYLLGVTTGTLAVWRSTGRYGLPFVKVGRAVRYRPEDVTAFIEGRMQTVA